MAYTVNLGLHNCVGFSQIRSYIIWIDVNSMTFMNNSSSYSLYFGTNFHIVLHGRYYSNIVTKITITPDNTLYISTKVNAYVCIANI